MKITFIRHAEKESVGEDPALTRKGIKQAKLLAKRLKKEKFDEFYCSDLIRAKQTAQIVSKKIKMEPKIEKSLNEFEINTVKKDKRSWSEEEKKHYKNFISFLDRLTKNPNRKKRILIIAHGLTNRLIASHFLEISSHKTVRFRTRETGINSIYWVEKFKNWRMRCWNDNSHIPKRLR